MKIIFLGTSHGLAEKGRCFSCALLDTEKASYFIDLGAPVGNRIKDLGIPFEKVRAAFITHMHADHTMNLCEFEALANFEIGMNSNSECKYGTKELYLPEKEDVESFKAWLYAVHEEELFAKGKCVPKHVEPGIFYDDGNIRVTAIPTKHLKRGCSFAFMVESEDKRVLFTGDLSGDFSDFPAVVSELDFDAVVCEITHFEVETAFDKLNVAKTKKIIFNHVRDDKVRTFKENSDMASFDYFFANDGDIFEV